MEIDMLILEANQVCPFASSCPHKNSTTSFCQGANPNRGNTFTCTYADQNGVKIQENVFRSKFDVTGKMEIFHD
jgi:hypothetical protein